MSSVDNGFFHGITQSKLELLGEQVDVPILYREASQITVIYAAKVSEVRKMLPTPSLQPATLAPGVAALALTVFEYRDTTIGPYNELAVAIPITFRERVVPLLTLARQMRQRTLHTWVQQLPVTTEIARVGGVELYGFPKIVAEIDWEVSNNRVSSELRHDGRRVLALTAPAPKKRSTARIRYVAYSMKQGRVLGAEVLARAGGFSETWAPSGVTLELDDQHPIANELDRALLSKRPVMSHWIPQLSSVLHAPTFLE